MRVLALLTPLALFAWEATGAAVNLAGGLSQSDLVHALTINPNLLPTSSRQVLAARLSEHGISQGPAQKDRPIKDDNLNAIMSAILSTIVNIKKIPPTSKVNQVQDFKSPWPGATRRKIRYGPYRIPPNTEENLESRLLLKKGLTNTMSLFAKKPCSGDCMITRLSASIEWGDGRTAVAQEGAYLHHVVLLNIGPTDPVCGGPIEHLFESGNERSEINFGLPGAAIKSGYHIKKDDVFLINTELMNMDDQEKWVWLELTYDVVEGHDPAYKDGKVIWMSIGPARCGESIDNPFGRSNLTLSAKPLQTKFVEYSIPWKARNNGFILSINSHLHDGGIQTDIYQNEKVICSSNAVYSMSLNAGMSGMAGHSRRTIDGRNKASFARASQVKRQEKKASLHIDHQEPCLFAGTEIPLKQGDKLFLRVDYDFDKYPGMRDSNGEMEEIMGMAGALVAFDHA